MSAAQAQARLNAKDALARTTQAVQSVKAIQDAARAASRGANNLGPDPNHAGLQLPNVPNGLVPGGLQVAPGVPANLSAPAPGENPKLWQGATLPRQVPVGSGVDVIIDQTAQQALLTWKTFNVGKDTTVVFNQAAGKQSNGANNWIAFNKILDPSGVPSQILGRIQADATVYLINQNGIVFGGGSQINLRSLVASSLAINDNLISRGLLNNPDGQFLFSSLSIPAGPNGTPAFTPATPLTPDGQPGDVVVQSGATITTPTSADHTGGRVALVGANVKNSGTISTPDGQTILAAGLQVGFTAHPSTDATLRGLDTYIGAVKNPAIVNSAPAGTATNDGMLDAPRADVTIAGKNVNQLGAIQSSTSVSLNGRIDLLADYDAVGNLANNQNNTLSTGGVRDLSPYTFLPKSSGTVTIGSNSVMQILPEYSSAETVVGTKLALATQVNIQGQAIHFASGSMLLAPNANVNVSAGTWKFVADQNPHTHFLYVGGQIYLDTNSFINLAGSTDISAPVSQNILSVQLRGSEFAGSPVQRTGILRGISINIDIRRLGLFSDGTTWVGTPLGDASGFVGLIQRPVGQLTIGGGTLNLKAGGSVVMQPGSSVDVSGGWINYQGGMVQTTRVVSGGRLLDISQATPDLIYDGIYTGQFTDISHAKYGVTNTYSHPLALTGANFEQTYSFGGDGGNLTISAPSIALDGDMIGQTVTGPRQRTVPPKLSSVSIAFQMQDVGANLFPVFSPTPPAVIFDKNVNLRPADAFALDATGAPVALRTDRVAEFILSPDIFEKGGFGSLTLDNADGTVLIPGGVEVNAPAGGSITINGANVKVAGRISAPGGSLTFNVANFSQAEVITLANSSPTITPSADSTRGNFTLESSGLLKTAGLIVDDRPTSPMPAELPMLTNGGTVAINGYNVDLRQGGVIDVSGGVAVSGTGKKTYGKGGTLIVKAGQDLHIASNLGGELKLGSTLIGFSGSTGATLSIQAPFVQIGGTPHVPRTLWLQPDFFSEGGFASFNITGLGGTDSKTGDFLPAVNIAAGTQIEPLVTKSLAVLDASGVSLRTAVYPEGLRTPVSLSFSAPSITDLYDQNVILTRGDIILGAGASIRTDGQTDPTRGVSFSGSTVAILGSVIVPGGTISISGKTTSALQNRNPQQVLTNVDLGPQSYLSTAGKTILLPDPRGFRVGAVLSGGTINVSGNIVAEKGALLDVSGTTGVLDLPPMYSTLDPLTSRPLNGSFLGYQVKPTRIDTNAGSINFKGDKELFIDATLRGFAGGPSAIGGTLTISSDRFVEQNGTPSTPLDPTLIVTQGGLTIPRAFYGPGQTAIDHPVLDANGVPMAGLGYFAANTFLNGGFDSLSLGGVVRFVGPVSIKARRSIIVATSVSADSPGGVIFGDSTIRLEAPYVAIGKPFQEPLDPTQSNIPFAVGSTAFSFLPTYGSGDITVVAKLIDVGNLSLQGIGHTSFIAEGGDIRGDGTFNAAGEIVLRAGQIYPATGVAFTIAATDKNVVIAASTSGSKTVTLASAILPPGFGVGSPLLGSTVQSINGATVTLAAGANTTIAANTPIVFAPGSGTVTIAGSGVRQLPLSAGGTLSIYASNINQGGVLRAPLGTINIGWNGEGTAPVDPITGQAYAVAQQVTLRGGSVTSISAIDPITGLGALLPYGLNLNGTSWIAPNGFDITANGAPSKGVSIGGLKVSDLEGSLIDLRGDGDLYSYRFVSGNFGKQDILASTGVFAVIPGYDADFAPYAAFNSSSTTGNLGTDSGYTNSKLSVGDKITVGASSTLPAGTYTLLPARYALLPGAVLITPKSGAPLGTLTMTDGSQLVSGYTFNSLDEQRSGQPVAARFEVASANVFRQRAEYDDSIASLFFPQKENELGATVARTPLDAGRLVIQGSQALTLDGFVKAQGAPGARNGLVEIGTSADILIGGPNTVGAPGQVVLDASKLSSYGAESLLIGGIRQTVGSSSSLLTVETGNITVDNAGSPLSAQDVILVANDTITLADGAKVLQSGPPLRFLDTLLIGDTKTPGSGNGALLRVSADNHADVIRSGVTPSTTPALNIGAGAVVAGASVILDSTNATNLSPQAELIGSSITLNSGQISLQLDNPGALQPTDGLVLTGDSLRTIQETASRIVLSSYTSFDVYGTGAVTSAGTLALHAAEFRTFNNGGGTASFNASVITLDNRSNGTSLGAVVAPSGSLDFNATKIVLGANTVAMDQATTVNLNATGGVISSASGSLVAQNEIHITAPVITAAKAVNYTIQATAGALTLDAGAQPGPASVSGGLGATLNFIGTSLTANSDIVLPSGMASLRATAGDLIVSGKIEAGGTVQQLYDQINVTDGGIVKLSSDTGSVTLTANSVIDVAANAAGGNAGSIVIHAPQGVFTANGAITGKGANGGKGGSFAVDAGSIPGGSISPLDAMLNTGGFTEERNYRVRTGNIALDGLATARSYTLSTDAGDITVMSTGIIDASGMTGGTINLVARGSVSLLSGSLLSVAAQDFSNAGKGGAISLEAGAEINGTAGASTAMVDLQAGSTINLTVASNTADSAALGQFTGTLHLRAPQNAAGTDVQINTIQSTILDGIGSVVGTSTITIEGYKIFTPAAGTLNAAVLASINANGTTFVGSAGTASATYNTMVNRIFGADPQSLYSKSVIVPGAEVINTTGNLTLGTASSTAAAGDWNMAPLRFGPKSVAGDLTLRASGNLVFLNTLSDGFASGSYNSALLSQNTSIAANAQSWSYRLVAGADFSAADFHEVTPLAANSGSLLLGRDNGLNISNSNGSNNAPGPNATTSNAVQGTNGNTNRFQVIRTGSGDIDIAAGGDVELLNEFATIYTAGTQLTASQVSLGGTFDRPIVALPAGNQGGLGAIQENPGYAAQYTFAGGNVTINAQANIIHLTKSNAGLVDDSSKELPINWLDRRGFVDPTTGLFGRITRTTGGTDVGSTTWWVDFSNFFEGVGALGGGNVTMIAGNDISNVDGLVPTNARMPGKNALNQPIAPNAAGLAELGGGDLVVRAGHDINGGVYYVERGNGTLHAGNQILTNSTRSPSLVAIANQAPLDSHTWLPTTLFAGKSHFDVSAAGDVLLGPVANPFLLPEGYNNTFWDKTYFSTFSSDASVKVTSIGGSITLRESAALSTQSLSSILQIWLDRISRLDQTSGGQSLSYYQPWLRLDEDNVLPFGVTTTIQPGTFDVTAFSGDINITGNLNLSPSPTGTIELLAAGSINGLQPNGTSSLGSTNWVSSTINLSDASPSAIPGITTPFAYRTTLATPNSATLNRVTGTNGFLTFVDNLFAETGSTTGAAAGLQSKLALHAPGPLHAGDTDPVRIYATGNISGLTLFSSKSADILAGNDLTDISLYIQNVNLLDTSIVSAGRDIIAYNANSVLRTLANSTGNTGDAPRAGDIQISGPGTLEVLAGRNLDLGTGAENDDGTGSGITSIGNARNPTLPFIGANVIVGAGLGSPALGLANSNLDVVTFLRKYVGTGVSANGIDYLSELEATLGDGLVLNGATIDSLTPEQKSALALEIFYIVLRDAGRAHNDPSSPSFGSYQDGFDAISKLFGATSAQGDINTRSRDIRTRSGGYINIFAPSGGLQLATATIGNPEIPPGIVTEAGGAVSIFTDRDVDIGISRIFTLRGGDIVIWSSEGNIAAGSSAKTVQSAPPTRVIIDPQTANVATDLAGLATGGGIGVLLTVQGIRPGDVDLIAPTGVVDAGDAGIRAANNLNIAATAVLNASNIQASGTSTGVPAPAVVSAPNIGVGASANAAAAAASSSADQVAKQNQPQQDVGDSPSEITVEVIGYGGGEDSSGQ